MATALITGATGYLGSHLAHALLERGYEIAAFRRARSSMARVASIQDAIRWYDPDPDGVERVFAEEGDLGPVLHTATVYGRASEPLRDMIASNIEFPLRLLDAAAQHGARLFVNTDTVLDRFTGPYAMSKAHFREWGGLLAEQCGVSFLNLKLHHFYGPGDGHDKFTTHVIRSCLNNVPRLALTEGLQKRDFIYIKDAVSAYMTALTWALEQPPGENAPGGIEIEIGSGEAILIKDLVERIHRITESSTVLDFGARTYRKNEPMFLQADTRKLHDLNWRCAYTLEEGLRETISVESGP